MPAKGCWIRTRWRRAPVGTQIVARANQSRLDYAPLNRCFRDADAPDPVAAGLEKLADPGTRRAWHGELRWPRR